MTYADLKRMFPNAAESFLIANASDSKAPCAVTQRPVPLPPVAARKGKAGHSSRIRVVVRSYRRRLLDPDNLCPKYFIDCLRYAEIIKDDTSKHIDYQVAQIQVKSKHEERTEIEITFPQ